MGYAYGFFWRCRAINDIAHLTSYRDAIGVPCIRALVDESYKLTFDIWCNHGNTFVFVIASVFTVYWVIGGRTFIPKPTVEQLI